MTLNSKSVREIRSCHREPIEQLTAVFVPLAKATEVMYVHCWMCVSV